MSVRGHKNRSFTCNLAHPSFYNSLCIEVGVFDPQDFGRGEGARPLEIDRHDCNARLESEIRLTHVL